MPGADMLNDSAPAANEIAASALGPEGWARSLHAAPGRFH